MIHKSATEKTQTAPHDFASYILAEMRCGALRARILQADIEAISIALKGGIIDPDQALAILADCDALRLVGLPPEATV